MSSEFSLAKEIEKVLAKNRGATDDEEQEAVDSCDSISENDEFEYDEECGEEEEEEVVEISENEMLALLDAERDPFEVCSQIFDKEKLFGDEHPEGEIIVSPNLTIKHLRELHQKGFVVIDNFIETEEANEIYSLTKRIAHTFKPACELKKSIEDSCDDKFRDNLARSDLIKWLHPKDFTTNDNSSSSYCSHCTDNEEDIILWKNNHTLRNIVLNKFKVIQQRLHEFAPCIKREDEGMELMWSLYRETGTFYEKHRDSFPSNGKDEGPLDQRKVTALLYLNTEWVDENDGGMLRVFVKPENHSKHTERITKEINPIACRLVLFLSGAVDHEVLKSFKDRVALTSWFS
ncbi:hypothetical protein C9374_004502 [Naegleria lovaniensis]|uniref:Fe2OG dioxygenase domain-containing protein n=1 Tax=Naegleria lovaniensis TaxID=51637 RepID=A0AA88KL21_NAELO|nr:uncharacterized protein C9374_004502 [Naegleria lovaniensis]KAG2383165.1 hypothetical protein C9374_004502 [Naegleria lovaniensis]